MMQFYGMYVARKQPWSADIDSSFMQMNQAMYNYMEGPSEFTITGTIRDFDITPRLHEITIPTLFIVGQMPNAQLAVIPNAAHLAMQDDSAKYVQTLATFLDKVDGR